MALAASFDPAAPPRLASFSWPQQFLLFAALFAGLLVLHAPLLRLPYFWDEAGYYVPAARDLYLTGSLIPSSVPSNAHPPLVMAYLALAWRVAGFSLFVTHAAMLAWAAFSLLGLFRLSSAAANLQVAWTTTALVAIYPVFFMQSSLALVDLPAAGLTFWGLLAYLEDRPWKQVFWFSLAALAKETAVLAPLALFAWQVIFPAIARHRPEVSPPQPRRTRWYHLVLSTIPLACWFAWHRLRTGFVFGNPDFFRYNVVATLDVLRFPFAMGFRIWQLIGYLGLYLLTLAGVFSLFFAPEIEDGRPRPGIALWKQSALAVVLLAYLTFMSAVGGAALARYLLPVVPLVVLFWVSTLWRRARYWKLIVAAVAMAFLAALFINPPYGFSLEDNLAYRDYITLHVEASRFLVMHYPDARVLTAWPASDELTRPWLGYVSRPFPVLRIEDFTAGQIALASPLRSQFDLALVFSTKYEPPHPLLENCAFCRQIKERFFGYHRDLRPQQIAERLGGKVVYQQQQDGQWIALISFQEDKENASLPAQPLLPQ